MHRKISASIDGEIFFIVVIKLVDKHSGNQKKFLAVMAALYLTLSFGRSMGLQLVLKYKCSTIMDSMQCVDVNV